MAVPIILERITGVILRCSFCAEGLVDMDASVTFLVCECGSTDAIGCSCFINSCEAGSSLPRLTPSRQANFPSGRSHYPGRPHPLHLMKQRWERCVLVVSVFVFQTVKSCGEMHTFA